MVEGLFVVLDHKAHEVGMPVYNRLSKLGLIKKTGAEMGKAIFFSKLYEKERKFDIRIRYPKDFRSSENDIAELKIPTIHGGKIPLKEIAEIKTVTGPAFVYRDNNSRFIAIKFSIRERDLGSTIKEAQERVNAVISLPKGYSIAWNG
jgi:cobalt-zinc-cadmium resistance protein CzcA